MSAFRRARFTVTLLLVIMALFVSAESTILQNVHAAGTLYLHPTGGNPGNPGAGGLDYSATTYGHAFTGNDVGVWGSLSTTVVGASITACSITSTPSSAITSGSAACALTSASGASVSFNGTFTVGVVTPGDYLIQVSGSGTGGPSDAIAQAILVVDTGPVLQLTPSSGPTGTSVQITATFLQPSDTSCTIGVGSGTTSSFIVSGSAGCSTFSVLNTTTGPHHGFFTQNATGSFTVGNVLPGQYVVQVSGSPRGDFAQAVFNVTAGPFIQLSAGPPFGFYRVGQIARGPTGTHVSIEGSNWLSTDTTCSVGVGSGTSSYFIASNTEACSVFTTGTGFTNITASFIVGNVPIGQYVVEVSGSPGGDFAQAIFNVTSGAFIQLVVSGASGRIVYNVGQTAQGPTGTHVSIEGSNWLSTDTTCSVGVGSGTPSSFIASGTAACSVFTTGTGFTNVTASFTVGNVLPGQYVVQVSGRPGGDFAQALFNVTSGAFIQLVVSGASGRIVYNVGQTASGPVATHVSIEGSNFISTDITCSISSPTSASVIAPSSAACSLFTTGFGARNVTGSFTIGNVLPGQYVIRVTGSPAGDFADAIFNVTRGAIIQLSVSGPNGRIVYSVGQVAKGPVGTSVEIEGTNFLSSDTSCSISSSTSGFILGAGCAIFTTGFGVTNVTGSFIVGNVLPGQYVVQVTGSPGSDFAQAIFNVTLGAQIALSPGSGQIGAHVFVNGTGFLLTDTSCTIVSGSSNSLNPIVSGSQACIIRAGTGMVSGSFTIGYVAAGQYVIQVNGNQGDSAQAVLSVLASPASLILYPTNATNGATVSFTATGFSEADTGCTVQAVVWNNIHGTTPTIIPNNNLITSPTCSIVTPTVAQGSFVVGPYATTNLNWTVQVKGTPVYDIPLTTPVGLIPSGAVFNVTASIVVTPTSGTRNTVFTFTGSGFSSTATFCQAHIYPPFPTVPPTLPPACYISTNLGQVSGSVVAPGNVTSGTYAINVGENLGHNATGIFTIGTPSALIVLDPASVAHGQPVAIAGTGFNPNDTYCVVTSGGSAGTPPWAGAGGVAPVCSISGGYASGAFTVSTTAVGGYYLITITAWGDYHKNNVTGGDFASNFLAVNLASTITTFSTTTATVTSTTQLTTSTTSVATSYTYYSTTYSTTGILFTTYSHLTVATVSGLTSTTETATTSTSLTLTTVTVTTTTAFTTVSCGPLPCGYAVGSLGINPSPLPDNFGLLAALLLIVPMLLRRLFS